MRELSLSLRRIAAATLNGRLPITFTGEVASECREIDREEVGVDDVDVREALLEPRRETRIKFHQRQRTSWPRSRFSL